VDRDEQIEAWKNRKWRKGKKGADYQDIAYRVAVMPDSQDPDVWTWVINKPPKEPEWSEDHYDDKDAAMQAALVRLADILGI
jgi:hypothetical protein